MDSLKEKIVKRFDQAAHQYDQLAVIQLQMAHKLMGYLQSLEPASDIVDMGCGTGLLTRLLQQEYGHAQLTAVDASASMLAILDKTVTAACECADFDFLPFENETFDWVVSNAALQWSRDTAATLTEWLRILKKGRHVVFSTFLSGSLCEWDQAWQQSGSSSSVNELLTLDKLRAIALPENCYWQHLETKTVQTFHGSVKHALMSVRGLGAQQRVSQQLSGLMGRKRWQSFVDAYETMRQAKGFPLTYEVCYGIIKKD